ncbi:hypothetical protein B0T20DRAFT_420564 [Sordaria brevicollis]|uniref:serine--tRNA ligase n=1 Tax=Sordaria brevicollis TaxID=83679 RepID=A0AAE0P2Z2_SORBR|nr:hypothetical protein B0T20DRAFT_420564 [Sordaria brevicollis]
MIPSRLALRLTRPRPIIPSRPSTLRLGQTPRIASLHNSSRLQSSDSPAASRPSIAPKPVIDIKHIRQNPELYSQNCIERNYHQQATYPQRINDLHAQWQAKQREARSLRERSNVLRRQLTDPGSIRDENADTIAAGTQLLTRDELLAEARKLKSLLSTIEAEETRILSEIESLALSIPNLTSPDSPRGPEPKLLSLINEHPEPVPSASDRVWRSHVHIGTELGLLDFASAATVSGWGWYFLLDEAAQLEQALISYALDLAVRSGWRQVSPPSIVYSHIAAACGFQPRDQNGETQIYSLSQSRDDIKRGKPELSLAGTSEIPLAGMHANKTLLCPGDISEYSPLKYVAVSRCYRAEAGSRGLETKGLYRVHEFSKVELFGWTYPSLDSATDVFNEIVDLQTDLLSSLGLHCRVLEMPTHDLGASATRKIDIEAFFPSRRERNDGWGEVSSASICTDYQARRLGTRLKGEDGSGKMVEGGYPYTVNGTAMAVPRVVAALLENGWDEETGTVVVPEVLRGWMPGGRERIGPKVKGTGKGGKKKGLGMGV